MSSKPTSIPVDRPAQAENLKSEEQQRHERRELYLHCILTRTEYELYGFNRQGIDYPYMLNFLNIHEFRNRFRPALNDNAWKGVLDNKWFFQLHCHRLGLPAPESYGVYQTASGVDMNGRPLGDSAALRKLLEERRPASLVIKPVGGIMGQGILILDEIRYEGGRISALTNTGRTLQFEEIAAKLDSSPNVVYTMVNYRLELPGYILQKKLSQHALLSSIAPQTTNTLRVVTFVDRSNEVHIQFSILRAGRNGNTADNWEQGGISIAVNPVTGTLGRGVLKPKYGGQWVERHPDSGVVFTGLQLPYWREVVDVCTRAAKAAPGLRSVGWDVAITPDGPVLIEGNPDWDLPMVQVHTQGLLQPEVRKQLADFGLSFPEGTLPPISLRKWCEHHLDTRMNRWPSRPRRLMQLMRDPALLYMKITDLVTQPK